jgi:hypothetical protein
VKLQRLRIPRIWILVGFVVISLGQAGSSAYQRYLRVAARAETCQVSEWTIREKAGVCEELAPKLREVAVLARELAKSASSDFERSKWLEMAHKEEDKATELEHESIKLMSQANQWAARANALSRLAWRPWLPEP